MGRTQPLPLREGYGVYDNTTGTTKNSTTTGRTGAYTGTTSGTGMAGGR